MSSLKHSYKNDTYSDEELPSFEFVQNVQDRWQKVSENTISEESVDSTKSGSSMASIPALNAEGPKTETVELNTSRVPENLVVPMVVSPPVFNSRRSIPFQPPPVAAAEEVP